MRVICFPLVSSKHVNTPCRLCECDAAKRIQSELSMSTCIIGKIIGCEACPKAAICLWPLTAVDIGLVSVAQRKVVPRRKHGGGIFQRFWCRKKAGKRGRESTMSKSTDLDTQRDNAAELQCCDIGICMKDENLRVCEWASGVLAICLPFRSSSACCRVGACVEQRAFMLLDAFTSVCSCFREHVRSMP